jgi:NADH:ubiquinone oxidoreductase subunit C
MDYTMLKQQLESLMPEATFPENKQIPEILVTPDKLHECCVVLKTDPALAFDYLISATAVDWNDHLMMVYHLTSSRFHHVVVIKTRLDDPAPEVSTVSDIWKTAEYHEREVYDLFGIRFLNHPDLRRLFLDDGYGFPLRKNFSDESRMIVR